MTAIPDTAPMAPDRRDVMRHGAAGMVLAMLGGRLAWTTPAAAAVAGAAPRAFSAQAAAWLGGLGEAIAPPSRAAGLVAYLDHHVSVAPAESLLALRYLDVPPPYADFYRPPLAALQRAYGDPPAAPSARWAEILASLGAGKVASVSPLFLFAVRLDAIDIAYGTRAGFARLGIDYLPHIEPEQDW